MQRQPRPKIEEPQLYADLTDLATLYGVELKKERAALYWRELSQFDAEVYADVLMQIKQTVDHFPTLSTFHKIARERYNRNIDGSYCD